MTPEQLAAVVEQLTTAQKLQRGAWAAVIEAGRKYAQMKAFGSFIDSNGCNVKVSYSDIKTHTEMYAALLLREVERAFEEDSQMGIAVSELLT